MCCKRHLSVIDSALRWFLDPKRDDRRPPSWRSSHKCKTDGSVRYYTTWEYHVVISTARSFCTAAFSRTTSRRYSSSMFPWFASFVISIWILLRLLSSVLPFTPFFPLKPYSACLPPRFYLRNEQALILLRRERFQFELRLHYTPFLFLHYRRVKSSCWFRRNVQAPSGHFRSFRGESLCFKLVNCKEECLQYSVPRSWRTRTRTRPLWRSCSLWRSARLLVYKTEALSGV